MNSLRLPLCVGFWASFLTFVLSMFNNTWLTSLVRALFGFALFFILMIPILWIIHMIVESRASNVQQVNNSTDEVPEANDTAATEQELSTSTAPADDFVPLTPPRITRLDDQMDMKPEDIAKVVRVLSEQT